MPGGTEPHGQPKKGTIHLAGALIGKLLNKSVPFNYKARPTGKSERQLVLNTVIGHHVEEVAGGLGVRQRFFNVCEASLEHYAL